MSAIRQAVKTGVRGATMAALVTMTVASSQAMVVPAWAEEPKAKPSKPVPALRSEPAPETVPEVPVGDFADVPLEGVPSPAAAARPPFDAAQATLVEAETTANKQVYVGPDGTRTAAIDARPVRFQDSSEGGAWKDIDLTLVPGPGGGLVAKSAPAPTTFGGRADATVARVETTAGTISLRHPGATTAAPTSDKNVATYAKALPGGRDIVVSLTGDGFENSVVLPDAKASPTYIAEFSVPPGLSAHDLDTGGVDFVDSSGQSVATFGSALAHDASFAKVGSAATAPVSVRIVPAKAPPVRAETTPLDSAPPTTAAPSPDSGAPTTSAPAGTSPPTTTMPSAEVAEPADPQAEAADANTVSVEVGIDPAWLSSPERVFPVTVDPALTITSLTSDTGNRDTFVYSGEYADTSYGAHPWLAVGSSEGGPHAVRSLIYFDMGTLPGPNVVVGEAHLEVFNWYSQGVCAAREVNLQGLGAAFTENTTWNNQPALDAAGVVSHPSFGSHTALGSLCPGRYNSLDATSLASRWLHDGAPNYGISLRAASETDPSAYKAFYSAQGTSPPRLWITYTHVPTVPVPHAPAEGVVLVDDSPTLIINPSTDPDPGETIHYWFRIGTGPNVVGGNVIDSGWINATTAGYVACPAGNPPGAICWTVPGGVLSDGLYRWHAFASDGNFGHSFALPPDDPAYRRSLRVTLRLGSGGPAPTDSLGPVQANLASGNVVASHAGPRFPTVGGDVGVGLVYNSAARTNGLLGEYYAGSALPAATTPPALVRTDAQVAFNWGDTAPAPMVGKDGYVVRWSGNVTVPSAGSYSFYAGTTDGIRIFVDNVQRTAAGEWAPPGADYRQVNGDPVVFGATTLTKPIRIEYSEQAGAAFVNLAVIKPGGVPVVVPASWLTAPSVGPLPAGWTLSAGSALAYSSARIGEHGVTLTDAGGGLHTYAATGADPSAGWGYTPPYDEDGTLARAADGKLSLTAANGLTYVFDGAGAPTAATSALDDANQASANYTWTPHATYGAVSRLTEITDPVSGRKITLRYRGFNNEDPALADDPANGPYNGFDPEKDCLALPSGQNLAAPPAGKLCQVDYSDWDGTFTRLWYDSMGQLVRISEDPTTDPMGTVLGQQSTRTDVAYNDKRRLSTVRDPLANEAMLRNVGVVPTDPANDTTRTLVTYYDDGRVRRVTLPVPYTADGSAAGARPGHEYTYGPGDVTTVADDGPAGDRTVGFDPAGRLLVATDATGHKSEYRWNAADRLLTTTTAAQTALASTTAVIYDDDDAVGGAGYGNPDRVQSSGRVTHGFGPAAPSCFSVAADVVTVSCGGAPHTRTQYDAPGGTDQTGLAVTGWDNRDFAGAPRLRAESVHTGGTLVDTDLADLPAGTAGVWSARYTGEIELGTGSYAYGLAATGGSARLFVDDTLVADSTAGGTGTKPSDIAGRHRFRVDFSATATDPELVISWTPPGQSSRDIASSDLAPRWAAPTTTTTDDDLGVPAMVASVEYESLFTGLIQKSIVDPEGLNLVTTVANEAGLFRRTTSRTLPANDPEVAAAATVYAYYANTASGAAACGQAAGVNQGGRMQTTTAASPDGTASGRQASVVYDPAGRVLATRVGSEDWSCLNYDRKGRIITRSFPADADQGGHIYTFNYDNPLVTLSKEGATTHSTTVSDMLGRVVSYTDRWAKTTTSTYDQSGRRTASSGPAGNLGVTYDAAGRVLTQSHDGALMATATSYDAAGALAAATYTTALGGGNGTTLAVARHPATGAVTKLTWANPAGAAIATDEVVRSLAGKVVDEKTDGSDAFGAWGTEAGANFVYDAAGRLDLARVEGQSLDYGFATSAGCGSQAAPGRNANRSSVSLNGATPTTYCYDRADRLTSSSDTAVGTPTYDGHGNTATLGTQTLSYDVADRHMSSTVAGGPTVTYERDASDRIVSRTEGATVIRYGFAGPGDSSAFTMDASNNVTERMIALMGGAMVTKRAALLGIDDVWSYPNIHGDVMAVANNVGIKQGATFKYDPFGQPLQALGAVPDNSAGNFDHGWLGQHQRPLEHAGTIATIEMGARQYVPSIGRFLEVDPVQGGSCNAYDYVCGDPVNGLDLNGHECNSRCRGLRNAADALDVIATIVAIGGSGCGRQVSLPGPGSNLPLCGTTYAQQARQIRIVAEGLRGMAAVMDAWRPPPDDCVGFGCLTASVWTGIYGCAKLAPPTAAGSAFAGALMAEEMLEGSGSLGWIGGGAVGLVGGCFVGYITPPSP